jgi:hypothetical protein
VSGVKIYWCWTWRGVRVFRPAQFLETLEPDRRQDYR